MNATAAVATAYVITASFFWVVLLRPLLSATWRFVLKVMGLGRVHLSGANPGTTRKEER